MNLYRLCAGTRPFTSNVIRQEHFDENRTVFEPRLFANHDLISFREPQAGPTPLRSTGGDTHDPALDRMSVRRHDGILAQDLVLVVLGLVPTLPCLIEWNPYVVAGCERQGLEEFHIGFPIVDGHLGL